VPLATLIYNADKTDYLPQELLDKTLGTSKSMKAFLKIIPTMKILKNIYDEVIEKHGEKAENSKQK